MDNVIHFFQNWSIYHSKLSRVRARARRSGARQGCRSARRDPPSSGTPRVRRATYRRTGHRSPPRTACARARGKVDDARRLWYKKFLPWNDSGFYENWQWTHKYSLKQMGVIDTDVVFPPQSTGSDYHKEELKALLRYHGKI